MEVGIVVLLSDFVHAAWTSEASTVAKSGPQEIVTSKEYVVSSIAHGVELGWRWRDRRWSRVPQEVAG